MTLLKLKQLTDLFAQEHYNIYDAFSILHEQYEKLTEDEQKEFCKWLAGDHECIE